MGNPRIEISVVFDGTFNIGPVISNLTTKLSAYSKFSIDIAPTKLTDSSGDNTLVASIRFNNKADVLDAINWVKAQIKDNVSVKDAIKSALVSRHICNHGAGVQAIPCDQSEFVTEWEYERK